MNLHFLYVNIAAVILLQGADAATPKFLYSKERLVMTADSFRDALGAFTLAQLPDPQPKCQVKLTGVTTPLTRRIWAIALDDLEHNLVTNEHGTYFAAGTRYTDRIYTRDISIAGILGANRFYPKQMKDSLMLTRVNMKALGYQVSKPHLVSEIDAPWKVIAEEDKEIMAKFKTNSYTRRTDDVVWMWAAHDLFTLHPELADWKWFHQNGSEFFKDFYGPWFDASDGLYRGQPLFHDITNSAYPKGMTIADCVLLKSLTTNCLYYKAMLSMADASAKIGLSETEKTAVAFTGRRAQESDRQRVHQRRWDAGLLQGPPRRDHAQPRHSRHRLRRDSRVGRWRCRQGRLRRLPGVRPRSSVVLPLHSRKQRPAQSGGLAVHRVFLLLGQEPRVWRGTTRTTTPPSSPARLAPPSKIPRRN